MDILSSVFDIKGIGNKTGKLFNNLGVYTIEDILLFFPRTYLIYPDPITPGLDFVNQQVAIAGRLKSYPKIIKTKRVELTVATVFVEDTAVELVWFNSFYIKNALEIGKLYYFYGKLELDGHKYKIAQPEYYSQEKYNSLQELVQPIYPLTKGLTNNVVKKAVMEALKHCNISESRIPEDIIKKNKLMGYQEAIKNYHFPESFEKLTMARKRLAYEEIFFFILNAKLQEDNSLSFPNTFDIKPSKEVDTVLSNLPFKLTEGQQSTYNNIMSDLSGSYITQRLVQGDVGSGKTMVAFMAMLNVVVAGYQAAIMAPTEVLAKQHYDTFTELLSKNGIDLPVALFIGSQKVSERKQMENLVSENDACFIVGTHALVSEKRVFQNLAFVVTDEQHRFGVKQRENLAKKGNNPHMLVMSATPIPRTLAMILYGNMHVSAIKELPAERLPIKTCVIKESMRKTAYKFVSDEVEKGHQVYIICPLVEASETTEAQNVIDYEKSLNNYFKEKYSVDVLHGKMKPAVKQEVMDRFFMGETQILVSTTVVEVGVNVPNATVIMIENANRFGLAALHQLRGRVGRGKDQSYCILMNSDARGDCDKRLDVLMKSNDGFYISQEDLKLRGPGDFFGVRQSGEFSFKIADIYNDALEIELASKDVDDLLSIDPDLSGHIELQNSLNLFLANQSYVL